MSALLRDSAFGQTVRFFTKNKVFLYPEEREDFECPASYNTGSQKEQSEQTSGDVTEGRSTPQHDHVSQSSSDPKDIEKKQSQQDDLQRNATSQSLSKSAGSGTGRDIEKANSGQDDISDLKREVSRPIEPQKTIDGNILVDWYTTDDPENPQNWTLKKKILATCIIYLYTLAVYIGSSIYTPSETGVMEKWGINITTAELGLALYVLGYGTGPMLWSPLSEIPIIGRNPPYIATFAFFCVLCVPTALAENVGGFMFARFLQGFFGSPCLATAGATYGDLYSLIKLPYPIAFWAAAATCGPALGPIISGFSVPAENWRWSLWEILWLAGPTFILMFFFLPETSGPNLLLRRARRLRKLTGNHHLLAQSEIDQANMNARQVTFEALVRPFQMMFTDPAVGFTDFYISLVYGIYYSFFEGFPLVYIDIYHFNVGELGLTFLSISVALAIALPIYFYYIAYVATPDLLKNGLGRPEKRLIPALVTTPLIPIGLFIFAWTSRASIHWIVSVIGVLISVIGIFIVFQCVFTYIPMIYPKYAASLFAGNDFARSSVAFAAILFGRPLYANLGIGPGTSLLAAFTVACCFGTFFLYYAGPQLRARSRFTAK